MYKLKLLKILNLNNSSKGGTTYFSHNSSRNKGQLVYSNLTNLMARDSLCKKVNYYYD